MPQKIMIVDDDVETLRLVGLMLTRQGYEVIKASNGIQALEMVKSSVPDLIIMDVMMADMDGFQTTRQLRKETITADIPILMFTAKSQVEDKVAGYEAGADEYITKPIHPAELIARVKALLARSMKGPPAPAPECGYMIAVVSPRGGMGASTLTLNLAISYALRIKTDVIAAELRPGHGSWAQDLGYNTKESLNSLLKMKPADIKNSSVETELLRTTYNGVRLLLADSSIGDFDLIDSTEQAEAVVRILPYLAPMVVLDIGVPILPKIGRILALCDEIILITEPFPGSLRATKAYMQELNVLGFGKSKLLTVVMINRIRADMQLTITQVQEAIGQPVAQVIPPVPEIAYQAALQFLPLVKLQPDGLFAQQFRRLAEIISQRKK